MKAGLVVLNYNDSETTLKLIDSIKDYSVFHAVVIVDNSSVDNSPEILNNAALKYGYDFIQTGENKGYAFGNNFGAKYLIDKYGVDNIYVANPDIAFDEKVITSIEKAFSNYPEYGVLSAIMLDKDGSVSKVPYRNQYAFFYDVLDCFALTRKIQKNKVMPIDYSRDVMQVDVVQGSFWAIRSEILKKIDYLDENTFLYYEEMILGAKLRDIRQKSGILTACTYRHYHSISISKSIKKIPGWKIHLQSKQYYESHYNHICRLQRFFLKFCCLLSIAEKYVIAFIQDSIKRTEK